MYRIIKYSLAILMALSLVSHFPVSGQDQSTEHQQQLSESEIVAAIKADIADSSRIAGGVINVSEDSGLVTLSGTATSLLDKQMSVRIAKRTRGVNAVLDQLIVVASNRRDDDIREDVHNVLRINESVDEPRIAVDVSRGEVALIGKVASLAERRIA